MIKGSGSKDGEGRRRPDGGGDDGEPRDMGGTADASDPNADVAAALDDVEAQIQEGAREGHSVVELRLALNELNDKYMRLAAEFDNFRRRTTREKQEMGARAQASLAATLLESLDDLTRVTSLSTDGADAASFVEGVDLVARKLFKSLAGAGLDVLNPIDEKFNPALHEAVSTEPAASPDDDEIISAVFQPGYLFKGQLLRPARVAVRKWSAN